MREKAAGTHRTDERRVEDSPVPDAGTHLAGETHQEAAADLGVHAALPRGDQIQRHHQGGQRDPAHGGEAPWDDTQNYESWNIKSWHKPCSFNVTIELNPLSCIFTPRTFTSCASIQRV